MRARISSRRYRKAWGLGLVVTIAIAVLAGAIATAHATPKLKTTSHPTIGTSVPQGRTAARMSFRAAGALAVRSIAGCAANQFEPAQDASLQEATGFAGSFYGADASQVYINENGNLTFNGALSTFTPYNFTAGDIPMIAPFFADVDTRGLVGGGAYGGAYGGPYAYGSQHPITWGTGTLDGHSVFCVQWPGVGYDSEHMDKTDNFQVLLIDRSDTGAGNFDIEFNYDQIQWETGDSSGGTAGLGGTSAYVGWTGGDGSHFYKQPGSGVPGSFLDGNDTTGLIHGDHGDDPFGSSDGRYYFQIRNKQSLTVHKSGNGTGTVTSNPTGITCGADCNQAYAYGTPVTLTATPAAGSAFTGWTGCATASGTTCHVTIAAAKSVTARFMLTEKLTVNTPGSGDGTVSSVPAGISCGGDCTDSYPFGTSVTLTARAAAGSTFAGWSGGGCSGTGSTCKVTMNGARTVSATFMQLEKLTVNTSGNGDGTVRSDPAGISCGGDCSNTYPFGTSVTLTARAAGGSFFTGWSGGGCSGTDTTCTVTMNGAKTVSATFVRGEKLTVNTPGNGDGTVSSDPAGISCGRDCWNNFPSGTTVTLTARPAGGSIFTGWSIGGCSDTELTCTVTMNGTKTVSATFMRGERLRVNKTGQGTVTSNPAGVSCPGDCSSDYATGTRVTLTARAAPGWTFSKWTGACSGTGSCTVTMNSDKTVVAIFKKKSGRSGHTASTAGRRVFARIGPSVRETGRK